jgi:hypothetical protein
MPPTHQRVQGRELLSKIIEVIKFFENCLLARMLTDYLQTRDNDERMKPIILISVLMSARVSLLWFSHGFSPASNSICH